MALLIAEAPNLQYIDITQKKGTERKIKVEWSGSHEEGVNVVKVLDARTSQTIWLVSTNRSLADLYIEQANF